MRVCILYLLASALAPFHCKCSLKCSSRVTRAAKHDETIHRIFEVNDEHCALKCSSRLTRASASCFHFMFCDLRIKCLTSFGCKIPLLSLQQTSIVEQVQQLMIIWCSFASIFIFQIRSTKPWQIFFKVRISNSGFHPDILYLAYFPISC